MPGQLSGAQRRALSIYHVDVVRVDAHVMCFCLQFEATLADNLDGTVSVNYNVRALSAGRFMFTFVLPVNCANVCWMHQTLIGTKYHFTVWINWCKLDGWWCTCPVRLRQARLLNAALQHAHYRVPSHIGRHGPCWTRLLQRGDRVPHLADVVSCSVSSRTDPLVVHRSRPYTASENASLCLRCSIAKG